MQCRTIMTGKDAIFAVGQRCYTLVDVKHSRDTNPEDRVARAVAQPHMICRPHQCAEDTRSSPKCQAVQPDAGVSEAIS